MNKPIAVKINGKIYVLRADDVQAMRAMPNEDRAQLIAMLTTLKTQHEVVQETVPQTQAKHASATAPQTGLVANRIPAKERSSVSQQAGAQNTSEIKPSAMGKGDIDQVFAQLVREEKNNQKSELRPATIYKAVAVIMVIIVVISFF